MNRPSIADAIEQFGRSAAYIQVPFGSYYYWPAWLAGYGGTSRARDTMHAALGSGRLSPATPDEVRTEARIAVEDLHTGRDVRIDRMIAALDRALADRRVAA